MCFLKRLQMGSHYLVFKVLAANLLSYCKYILSILGALKLHISAYFSFIYDVYEFVEYIIISKMFMSQIFLKSYVT